MRLPSAIDRIKARATDESGTAMLEFVLIAPVLSYMLIAVLFMHNHIDYAMDSSMRFREMGWKNILPANAKNVSGKASDDSSFFTIPLRPAMAVAMATGLADANAGAALAGLQVGDDFYSKYDLKRNNYKDNYETKAPFNDGGWGTVLGSLGTFFAAQIGTGAYQETMGLKNVGWEDRYPYSAEPWMRQYSEKWDPCKFPLVGLVMEYQLYIMAMAKTPVPRVDTRDNRDIGATDLDTGRYTFPYPLGCFDESAPNTLKLTPINGKNNVLKAIQ